MPPAFTSVRERRQSEDARSSGPADAVLERGGMYVRGGGGRCDLPLAATHRAARRPAPSTTPAVLDCVGAVFRVVVRPIAFVSPQGTGRIVRRPIRPGPSSAYASRAMTRSSWCEQPGCAPDSLRRSLSRGLLAPGWIAQAALAARPSTVSRERIDARPSSAHAQRPSRWCRTCCSVSPSPPSVWLSLVRRNEKHAGRDGERPGRRGLRAALRFRATGSGSGRRCSAPRSGDREGFRRRW